MALGEAVGPKTFELLEGALGEIPSVAVGDHAFDEAALEAVDAARELEGRHGAAQFVGLRRREAGADHRHLHCLLLEQRHAEGFAQHSFQLGRRVSDLFQTLAAAQIGVDHIALDRSGAHDRDLNDEVVELVRFHPRQHRHLRAALDLEDAEGVGATDHREGRLIL